MSHTCHAPGCALAVPPKMFACRRHWYMVPEWLRSALWAVYRPGQEVDKRVTEMYLLTQTRCRLAIAEKEANSEAPAIRADLGAALRRRFAAVGTPEVLEALPLVTDDLLITEWDAAIRKRFA